jgi:CheY-like chemotaxis protein
MVDGGEIEIKTSMKKYSDNSRIKKDLTDFVCVTMKDNGCGIKSTNLDKIFDPFFTTKSVGKGTGLGLSVVYGIMKSHKGFVEVESEIDKGTMFYLYFPPSRRKYLETDSDNGNRKLYGTEKILVVDDETMIRESVSDILNSLGYLVIEAPTGADAIKILKKETEKPDLAIIDMSMPKMNGVDTIRKIKEFNKDIKILLSSGHSDKDKYIPDDINLDGILPKPYRLRELALKIRQVLSQ